MRIEKREIKIRGVKSRAKNPYLRLSKTPNINLRGKWLIMKGFKAGKIVTMEIEYEKITLRPKKEKEQQPNWE
ncbi:MAG: type I toxin-antitoxin system SymE family toxin [Bacteroidetes bacterium]|nr:type I toxin-antitoxin system SymE family toxin [Bacteroidota bacterium]